MAVYVMLSFDDDNEAHRFVKETLTDGEIGYDTHSSESELEVSWVACTVRGVWKKPTIFCDCESTKRVDGFTRGRKYGWWVHAKCGKPSKLWAKGDAWHGALGRNLLPQSELAPEYRSPENPQQPLWADLEDLLNPHGPVEFVQDKDAERVQRMVRKGDSLYGPMHKGVVRRNEV